MVVDDSYLVGPKDATLAALDTLCESVQVNCGLLLQRDKTEILDLSGISGGNETGLKLGGAMVEGQWENGIICYGIPIGSDDYVRHMLSLKVNEIEEDTDKIISLLQNNHQALWAVFKSSITTKFDYWLTLCLPSLTEEAARRVNSIEQKVLEILTGGKIPTTAQGHEYECPLIVPVSSLNNKTFQKAVIEQPIRMGGLGIRDKTKLRLPAFIGGVEQALSSFTGIDGICQSLTNVLGNMDEILPDNNWQHFINSESRTGKEFLEAWQNLQNEARECSDFLSLEFSGPLSVDAQGAGLGSDDGSTRQEVIRQLEELRGAVILEGIKANGMGKRQVQSMINRDKLTTAWLQVLPGPEGLSNAAISEAMSLVLCLPSPICRSRVGEKVGKRTVDIYGDSIQNEHLPQDDWRHRHDKIKMTISSLCKWARLPFVTEVFGLFSHLIPAQALNRMEAGQKRQGMVPDFRMTIPTPMGGNQLCLAELKVIACSQTRYPARGNTRATDKRASQLQGEYVRKARNIDKEISDRQPGPVESKLQEYGDLWGFVFGAWGEASYDVHQLIHTLAESRLKHIGLPRGRPGSDGEMNIVVAQIRKTLSVASIKAQVECLLSRVHQIGESKQLSKQREWALREDERMKKDRRAEWIRKIDGVKTLRKGHIKTA